MLDTEDELSRAALMDLVRQLLHQATGVELHVLQNEATFQEIGLTSLAILNFNELIQPIFANLNKTLLFDCRCIRDVATHLLREHPKASAHYLQDRAPTEPTTPAAADTWPLITALAPHDDNHTPTDIAIVGLHGRFPGANTLDELWQNLLASVDSVGEIPVERWPLEGFFEAGTDSRNSGLSYAKWGGFLQNIDQFDAQFFAIPPREAACLDPQERLFLECAWHALEDSGHLGERSQLLRHANGALDIGVFVGITSNTYPLLGPALWQAGQTAIPNGLPWSVANRVSFALDLCGPSLAVDTACSSSLTALHLAIDSLRKGECRAALVGAVNLYTHPAKYVQLCQQHMLSPSGRCHTFGSAADGFVPGEGVAALVLKPLARAQRDGDRILAVLKGSAVNHGGRTNGYTVPSASSQAALIEQALADARVPAASISYIEAHGTGTRLGDPIELQGLKQALGGADATTACHIGSIKANFGHLEAAAGMASLSKVVLQLQHRRLAPSLHAQTLNPDAGLEHSHLQVVRAARDWTAEAGVRRAGISSFGAGGANAHVIVEQAPDRAPQAGSAGVAVYPLSARTETQLREQARALLQWLQRHPGESARQLAYTLQCCRPAFEYRFALAAGDLSQLQAGLKGFLQPAPSSTPIGYQGRLLTSGAVSSELDSTDPEQLAVAWVEGRLGTWSRFWPQPPSPLAAPLYPFVADRHALPRIDPVTTGSSTRLQLDARQFFLRDHQVQGQPVLPAAAYLDFCYNEARRQGLELPLELHKLTWASPIRFEPGQVRTVECRSERLEQGLRLEFQPLPASEASPSFRGDCRAAPAPATNLPSLARVHSECPDALALDTLYPTLERLGIAYGPTFRCLAGAWLGEAQALTEVRWRAEQRLGEPLSALDPALLDAVLQSAFVTAVRGNSQVDATFVPYTCQSLRCYGPLTEHCFVHVRARPSQASRMHLYDFQVFAASGQLLMAIEAFAFREYRVEPETAVHLLEPYWQPQPAAPVHAASTPTTLVLCSDPQAFAQLPAPLRDSAWQLLAAPQFRYQSPRTVEADLGDPRHIELLLRLLTTEQLTPERLLLDLREIDAEDGALGEGLEAALTSAELLRQLCQGQKTPHLHIQVLLHPGPVSALEGLLRSVVQEIPSLSASLIETSAHPDAAEREALARELLAIVQPGVSRVSLARGERHVASLRFVTPQPTVTPAQWASGDVLVISGGLGAVGRALGEALAKIGGLRLALLGRRTAEEDAAQWLAQLKHWGAADAGYWQADCADANAVHTALVDIRQRLGGCHGVIHCAGVLQDGFFLRQPAAERESVLRGKTLAALHLDQATASDPLKLFMVCSSLAGVYGNVGQSTYALANAWLDRFMQARQQRCTDGQRHGRSLSIAWPLWQTEHGMQAPEPVRQWLTRHGLALLPSNQAVATFLHCLTLPQVVLIPVCGKRDAVARLFGIEAVSPTTVETPQVPPQGATDSPSLLDYLTRQLAEVTATALDKVDPDTSLEVFGLDSILVMELNGRLEQHFPSLSKTVLFEVRSLRELAALLSTEHPDDVARLVPSTVAEPQPEAPSPGLELHTTSPILHPDADGQRQDIAIIGLAGRYPGARDAQALWQHLAAGDDLISEVTSRWEQPDGNDRLYARWGGLVDDFDCFDPLFFGISPRDAERMDPQERLFLQTAWHAVEDAGYTPQTLSGPRQPGVDRRRVAVVAGVMYGEYQFYGASSWPQRPATLSNSSYASIANRVSFCLDLEGPSFAIDSMCSSSLTSLHLACDLIRSGSCELALAGGVNLSLHPYKYRMLCELNFASTQGQCRSFGADGDGYVPGEGVGVVLLKPLSQALRDGDHIHGVIRGSELNHGGRTSGYTVPNADAQAQVIGRALRRSGLPATRLGYIEAHGTGTSLGDPIEIRGLGKALAAQVPADWQCPIGSIKANIGHLESAAGMAALTKVLLQFKHRQLAPSIHAQPLNPNIDFSKTPFVVQQRLAAWPEPADGLPRVAAISSFGAGGANAHLLLEDARPQPTTPATGAQAFVFSARSTGQLRGYLQRFVDCLEHERALAPEHPAQYLGLRRYTTLDVARTLLDGRQCFDEARLAVIATDFDDLRQQVGQWLMSPSTTDTRVLLSGPKPAAKDQTLAQAWLAYGAPQSLPSASLAWRKVPLPGYEFLRRRYWISSSPSMTGAPPPAPPSAAPLTTSSAVPTATPQDILDRLARREISQEQARDLLRSML
ncbi:SDR family NAD(P)-dependent oxidoreductase [Pseudomonas putida]|uniref:SDR family NAD(P)-dependent oxidoreductase n=1 Tax=Pseudomonas putida TaxID=303 RepID=UPI0023641670|nr:SDR family NAD(P)-dependent oxidoreductase [Pseudomonas putida]MDD2052486.1 SDR family NAD(P)-dependent oxidoreductase [Pseudomonas putida]